jgi:peptide/nickel transport system permease protein
MVFAVNLGWVPTAGWVSIFDNPFESIRAMILPASAIGLGLALGLARFVRSAMLEQLTSDYIRTARAKGASDRRVVWRHAFPNAMVPTVTILGIQLGVLLGGTVVIERVFTRPGVGSLLVGGIGTRDYALVQGVVLLVVVWFAVISLLVDISYGIIDPRIRR